MCVELLTLVFSSSILPGSTSNIMEVAGSGLASVASGKKSSYSMLLCNIKPTISPRQSSGCSRNHNTTSDWVHLSLSLFLTGSFSALICIICICPRISKQLLVTTCPSCQTKPEPWERPQGLQASIARTSTTEPTAPTAGSGKNLGIRWIWCESGGLNYVYIPYRAPTISSEGG